jgi:hypothetical protein
VATVTSVHIVKKFTYRGDAGEEWENRYAFVDPPPVNSVEWKALADGLIAQEKTCYPATSSVVRAYGYDNNDPKPQSVWSYDYEAAGQSVPGTFVIGTGRHHVSGDQAAVIWWKFDHRSHGHYIFCRNYFHDGDVSDGDSDAIGGDYATALGAFTTFLSQNGGKYWGGRRGLTAQYPELTHGVLPSITTRTLHRRRKKKRTTP